MAKRIIAETSETGSSWPPKPVSIEAPAAKRGKLTTGFLPADALLGTAVGGIINFLCNILFVSAGSEIWIILRKLLLPQSQPVNGDFGTGSHFFLWIMTGLSLLACFMLPAIKRPRNSVLTVAYNVGACIMAFLNIAFWLWFDTLHFP